MMAISGLLLERLFSQRLFSVRLYLRDERINISVRLFVRLSVCVWWSLTLKMSASNTALWKWNASHGAVILRLQNAHDRTTGTWRVQTSVKAKYEQVESSSLLLTAKLSQIFVTPKRLTSKNSGHNWFLYNRNKYENSRSQRKFWHTEHAK